MRIIIRSTLFLLLLVIVALLIRVAHAAYLVQKASRFGIRYAQFFEWSHKYCPGSSCQTDADKQEARLASIHDAIAIGFGYDDYANLTSEIDPQHLTITICSNSDGHQFVDGVCEPEDFAGEQGSEVFISLRYDVSMIPWLSERLIRIPLSSSSEAIVECLSLYRVGVRHPLNIRLHGEIREEFSLSVEGMEGVPFSIDCPSGNVSLASSNGPAAVCEENVVVFSSLDWEELPVMIFEMRAKDQVISIQAEPRYISFFSPSESCYEIGWGNKYVEGTADIYVP